jgi:hypothetical protein
VKDRVGVGDEPRDELRIFDCALNESKSGLS